MFNWFKRKEVEPQPEPVEEEVVPEVVVSTKKVSGRPQVQDYPRSEYNAYWEIFHTVVDGRHKAKVRFCKYTGGIASESEVTSATKEALFEKVNALLLAKMQSFKR